MNASPNPFRTSLSITFLEDRLAPAGTGVSGSPYLPPLPSVPSGGPLVVIAPPCQPVGSPPPRAV